MSTSLAHSASWHKDVEDEFVISIARGVVNTIPCKPVGTPDKLNSVNIPEPATISFCCNENPKALEPPVDIVNPELATAPPEAPVIVAPVIVNWNPAIAESKL